MTIDDAVRLVDRTLEYLPPRMTSDAARVVLLAIGLQESRFQYRRQIRGPARGFWQFERGGGVRGVMQFPTTAAPAREAATRYGVEPTVDAVYNALEHQDELACAFARLLLWTDPQALPSASNVGGGWQLYLRTWRPGKPHPHTWADLHQQAREAI